MAKDLAMSIVWSDDDMIPTVDCLNTATILYGKDYSKQRVGEWVDKPNPSISNCYACSVCDEQICTLGSKPKYCPNCGAKMKVGE